MMVEADLQLEDLVDHHKYSHKGIKCPKCDLGYETLDWYCYKDNVKMEEADVELVYNLSSDDKLASTQKGIKCPVCGMAFFLEYFALTRLVSAEEMFETK